MVWFRFFFILQLLDSESNGHGAGHRIGKNEVVGAATHNEREEWEIAGPDIFDK